MEKIKIIAKYLTMKVNDEDIRYQVEEVWTDRPAWIKIIDIKEPTPRFLSIQVLKYGELIYKAFGHYYYPIDYTNDEERRFMDGMAEEYDEMVASSFNIPMAKALLSKIPLSEIDKSSNLLDIGCGTGIMTEILVKEGFSKFTLVDFSEKILTEAKKKLTGIQGVNYENLDIIKDLPKGHFDMVVSVMLFNTFSNEATDLVLSRLVRQISEKGLFCVLEDSEKPAYKKYFDSVVSEMIDVGLRTKYIFIGRKKE